MTMLTFRCPPALQQAARRAAEQDGRTLSNWLRLQLERHLRAESAA